MSHLGEYSICEGRKVRSLTTGEENSDLRRGGASAGLSAAHSLGAGPLFPGGWDLAGVDFRRKHKVEERDPVDGMGPDLLRQCGVCHAARGGACCGSDRA